MFGLVKLLLFPVLLAVACVIAGLYGALHNQISYTVSPEYFHANKFHQFAIPANLHDRLAPPSWAGMLPGGWESSSVSPY